MITSIHQPMFFPWLGLLDKVAKSDKFIFFDDAQRVKGTNQYRNTFFSNGKSNYIGLPVSKDVEVRICDLAFTMDNWREDHLNKILNYYRKAPFFKEIYPLVEQLYKEDCSTTPCAFIIKTMLFCFKCFNIEVETYMSSELKHHGKKAEIVLDLCKAIDTDIYLSGRGAKEYMTEAMELFMEANIKVYWHDFLHPVYQQSSKFSFVEGLSSLDLLFFQGKESGNNIFWSNVKSNSYEI